MRKKVAVLSTRTCPLTRIQGIVWQGGVIDTASIEWLQQGFYQRTGDSLLVYAPDHFSGYGVWFQLPAVQDTFFTSGYPEGAYQLRIARDGIFITAQEPSGWFYGAVTLEQLFRMAEEHAGDFR